MLGDDPDVAIADRRYGAINTLIGEVTQRPEADAEHPTLSDQIDSIVTHPLLGLPIFAAAMWVLFQMTASVSSPAIDWIDSLMSGPFTHWVDALLGALGLGGTWLRALLVDGVVAGVGGVLVFVPVLFTMYFFIAVLEDSGYMARAAFLMDRFMHLIGLHGKSFIPMLLGFGCSVPGVYATRTLEDPRDRILTGLLVPFMSCGARLPVYVIVGAAFFGARAGTLVFAMYMTGVVVAIAVGLLLKNTLFRAKDDIPFVIELPPYRLPSLKGVMRLSWERTKEFVARASTVILAASVAVWLLLALPVDAPPGTPFAAVDAEHSALAALSRWMSPVFRPAGFGSWRAASSLVTGFVAKEVIVSTLSVVYVGQSQPAAATPTAPAPTFLSDVAGIGTSFVDAAWRTVRALAALIPGVNLPAGGSAAPADPALASALRGAFTPLAAVAFCVFVLLTAPCVTTISALRHEFGARWMAFSIVLMLAVAWVAAVAVYQGGLLLGLG